jgi:hypothetical protein
LVGVIFSPKMHRRGSLLSPEGRPDLVVGAVLLDDVDDVLDEAGFADALGDGPGGLVLPGALEAFGDALAA